MSNIDLFPVELRTASVVPRWSIVWTLNKDKVDGHSYYVAVYARQIARLIGWKGDMGDLLARALFHDLDEVITGDICSPIKHQIIDGVRAEEFLDVKMMERLPDIQRQLNDMGDKEEDEEAWAIVRAADKLDALLFLIVERRMGNGVVSDLLPSVWANLEAAWRQLPAATEDLAMWWNTVIVPTVENHKRYGGYGVT